MTVSEDTDAAGPSLLNPAGLRAFVTIWIVGFAIWLAVNASLALDVVLPGAVIAAGFAAVFATRGDAWQGIRWTPRGLYHFLAYAGVFLVELVRANLNMMRYVYARRIEIRPGIVKVRTRLKSPIGRLALANSIALTPGSLVMSIDGETLYIHWLDVRTTDIDAATLAIVGPFEKHLEVVFG